MSETPATAVLSVTGDIDARVVETYYERASELLRPGVERLIIDLARTEFIDSSAIALLVRINDLAVIDGSDVHLANVGPGVLHTLDLAGMRSFLPIDEQAV